jgi:hypothetical protein
MSKLTRPYYVTFIGLLVVCPKKALSFSSDEFTNNNINKVIEEKINDHFMLPKEHLFATFFVYKKNLTNLNSKICHMKFSGSSQNHKVSDKIFVNNKFYHGKVTLIIFLLQTCILNIT